MGNAVAKSSVEIREAAFLRHYLRTFDGQASAIAAGFAKGSAAVNACRVLTRPTVQEAIAKALAIGYGVSKGSVAEEIAAIAFQKPGDYVEWDNNGVRITDSRALTDRQKLAVAGVEDRSVVLRSKDGEATIVKRDIRVKFNDKLGALRDLAKVLGFLKEREAQEAGNSVVFVIEGLGDGQRATITQQPQPRIIDAKAVDVTPPPPDPASAGKLVIDGT